MGCKPLTTWPKLHHGTPILDQTLMASYEPEIIETWHGRNGRVQSPDSPYLAACAENALYFIDQRLSLSSAEYTKQQLEGLIANSNGYWFIDEIAATAERRDVNGKTLFAFNPAYARVFFADVMNERNPSLNLPVHEPAGEWLVVYDVKNVAVGGKAERIGTGLRPRDGSDSCDRGRVDGMREEGYEVAFDTPRFEGETDAGYYQRMDKLHWG